MLLKDFFQSKNYNYAKEIATLLDAKENSQETIGDGKINVSIWENFYDTRGDNVEKTYQNNTIDFNRAVLIIANLLTNNGIEKVQNMLKKVGIEWKPSIEESTADSNDQTSTNNNTSGTKPISIESFTQEELDKQIAQIKERKEAQKEINAKRQEERDEIATTERASNGLTYNEAEKIISDINKLYVFDASISPMLPIEEKLKLAIESARAAATANPYYGKLADKMEEDLIKVEKARAAIVELENKHPILKSSEKLTKEYFSQFNYEDLEKQRINSPEYQAKMEELNNIATTEKASNGLTYKMASDIVVEVRKKYITNNISMKKLSETMEESIKYYERLIGAYENGTAYTTSDNNGKNINYYTSLLEGMKIDLPRVKQAEVAMEELETQYPNLNEWSG